MDVIRQRHSKSVRDDLVRCDDASPLVWRKQCSCGCRTSELTCLLISTNLRKNSHLSLVVSFFIMIQAVALVIEEGYFTPDLYSEPVEDEEDDADDYDGKIHDV